MAHRSRLISTRLPLISMPAARLNSQWMRIDVPLAWVFGWFKVLSAHTPQDLDPTGSVAAHFLRSSGSSWTGAASASLPLSIGRPQCRPGLACVDCRRIDSSLNRNVRRPLFLTPITVPIETNSSLTFSGNLSRCGYSYRVLGQASPGQLERLAAKIPTLSEGVSPLLPASPSIARLDVLCTRTWGEPQACIAQSIPTPAKKRTPVRHH